MAGASDALAGTGLLPGDVLLGKYRIERGLGRGGMGFVVLATHLGLEQQVAIKMLLPSRSSDPQLVARFQREARAAAKLRSEHVVRVTDVGALESGAPYLVMEYLVGRDLEAVLAESGALPIAAAVDRVLEAIEAVAEAHARAMVHRDLKPANLFLARRADGSEAVKLLDFGISKDLEDARHIDLSLTGGEAALGSPRFMSPEQLRSTRDADARTDLWSLGVILFRLLSNAYPFDGDSVQALAAQIASDPPLPLERFRPEVPAGLSAAIARCLEKDRERRFPRVAELAEAIAPYATPEQISQRLARIARASAEVALPAEDAAPRSADPNATKKRLGAPPPTESLGPLELAPAVPFVERLDATKDGVLVATSPRAVVPKRSLFRTIALLTLGGAAVGAIAARLSGSWASAPSTATRVATPAAAASAEPVEAAKPESAIRPVLSGAAALERGAPAQAPPASRKHPAPPAGARSRDPLDVRPY